MDLEKYKFYLGLGGVLVLYFFIYFFVVSPKSEELMMAEKELKRNSAEINKYFAKRDSLPTPSLIEYHNKAKEKLTRNLKEIKKFFEEKDKHLEMWFSEIERYIINMRKKHPDQRFTGLDLFLVVYAREKDKLVKSYCVDNPPLRIGKERLFDDGTTSPEEQIKSILPLEETNNIVVTPKMKTAQKSFWIVKGMLDILAKSKFELLTNFKLSESKSKTFKNISYHNINIEGSVDYKNLPLLLNNIINDKNFMTEITGLKIKKDKSYKPKKIEIQKKYGETDSQAWERYKKENKTNLKLPYVKIELEFRILDYEP